MSVTNVKPVRARSIRCDICPRRHVVGSPHFNAHLLGRDESDYAEPTRTEMREYLTGRRTA